MKVFMVPCTIEGVDTNQDGTHKAMCITEAPGRGAFPVRSAKDAIACVVWLSKLIKVNDEDGSTRFIYMVKSDGTEVEITDIDLDPAHVKVVDSRTHQPTGDDGEKLKEVVGRF